MWTKLIVELTNSSAITLDTSQAKDIVKREQYNPGPYPLKVKSPDRDSKCKNNKQTNKKTHTGLSKWWETANKYTIHDTIMC